MLRGEEAPLPRLSPLALLRIKPGDSKTFTSEFYYWGKNQSDQVRQSVRLGLKLKSSKK